MRGLSTQFFADLQNGLLAPIAERVRADTSLCLEIRDGYVTLYYRGGSLLKVSSAGSGYTAFFDSKYFDKADRAGLSQTLPAITLSTKADVSAWIAAMPTLKHAMDMFFGQHPKEEREAQQFIVRDNNFGAVSRATDYYLCDIEYANASGRFDLVAVHWPSNPNLRKQASQRRLALIEVKYGDKALAGTAGLHDHVRHINTFLETPGNLQSLKDEMVTLFNHKRALGLINCGKDLCAFSDEPPILLLVLINHDPDSATLRQTLQSLPPSPHAEVHIATGSLMGYGLFDPAIRPLSETLVKLDAYI